MITRHSESNLIGCLLNFAKNGNLRVEFHPVEKDIDIMWRTHLIKKAPLIPELFHRENY